jgi:hypothetical protein
MTENEVFRALARDLERLERSGMTFGDRARDLLLSYDMKPTTSGRVTDAIRRVFAEEHPWGPDLPYGFTEYVHRIAPVAAQAAIDAFYPQ